VATSSVIASSVVVDEVAPAWPAEPAVVEPLDAAPAVSEAAESFDSNLLHKAASAVPSSSVTPAAAQSRIEVMALFLRHDPTPSKRDPNQAQSDETQATVLCAFSMARVIALPVAHPLPRQ
jgi:hypothetical protein